LASESDFDFFNDGNSARVFQSFFSDHFMMGSTLLVQPGHAPTGAKPTNEPLLDPNAWFLPCQLESTEIPFAECPPFSQKNDNDEIGLSVADEKGHNVVRFRGRYSFVDAVRIRNTTYVIVTGHSLKSENYAAVLKPHPSKAFDVLC